MRISSNRRFIDGAVSPREAIGLLGRAIRVKTHEFWADDLNLVNENFIPTSLLIGHRQVTDAYLIGLANKHGGKLATLDAAIRVLLPNLHEQKKYLEIIQT